MTRTISRTLALAAALALPFPVQAWEPTRNVEFIIPAGTGGGADQMARAIQAIVAKHNLAKVAILPINKSGGAGAEGFLDVKNSAGDLRKPPGLAAFHGFSAQLESTRLLYWPWCCSTICR